MTRERERHSGPDPVQLQIELPYKQEARTHRVVFDYLERGYRITDLQRVTDREALVTLTRQPE